MRENASITYIKNGIEKSITLNNLDELTLSLKLKDIFDVSSYDYLTPTFTRVYTFREGVEMVVMKNLKFAGSNEVIIRGNSYNGNNVLILENCIFKIMSFDARYLSNIEIINPITYSKEKILGVNFLGVSDASLILGDDNNKIYMFVDVQNVNKFNLVSNDFLQELKLFNVSDVCLNKFNSKLEFGHYDTPKKLRLSDSLIENVDTRFFKEIESMELRASSIKNKEVLSFDNLKYLYLSNSNIETETFMKMESLEKLVLDDSDDNILDTSSYLGIGDYLLMGDKKFKNRFFNMLIMLGENVLGNKLDMERDKLIRLLYSYREKILKENEEKVLAYRRMLENKKIKEL